MSIANRFYRIGDLRLRIPKPIEHYNGTINATQVGPQCIQGSLPVRQDMPAEMLRDLLAAFNTSVPVEAIPESEDCTWRRFARVRPGQRNVEI